MFEPTNEQGVIALFCTQLAESDWKIVSIRTAFPDAILSKNGEEWRVEFEFKARNFIIHAHDFRECDLIVCWEDDFPECPIPVIEMRDIQWANVNPVKGNPLAVQVEYWKSRAEKAEAALVKTTQSLALAATRKEPEIQDDIAYGLDSLKTHDKIRVLAQRQFEISGRTNKSDIAKLAQCARGTVHSVLTA